MNRLTGGVFLTILLLGAWGAFPQSTQAAQDTADFEGLPEGLGREAVYFTCTACHSLNQFSQQRMSREEWDASVERMIKSNNMTPPKPWARTLILSYLSTHFGIDTEDWGGLLPGPGREEVFYTCQACHSLAIVLQQRLSRDSWKETLVWMVEEQGMPEPEPEELSAILDYLGSRLSADTPR